MKGKQYTGSAENGVGVICMQNRESRWNSGISGGVRRETQECERDAGGDGETERRGKGKKKIGKKNHE